MTKDRTDIDNREAPEDRRREQHQRVLRGDASVIATNSVGGGIETLARHQDREEKEKLERFLDHVQRSINQSLAEIDGLIGKYNAMADWHHEQAEAARERMREAADKLVEIDEFLSDADRVLKERERTGKLDRDEAIRLLRARGVEIDPDADDAALIAELAKEKDRAREERMERAEEYD